MKGESPLDYCVFQLNEARCELWICAGSKNEKVASGSFKPFVAHLRAAREQIVKGGNFVILQAPPFVGDGSPWFTKRTIERFVRFVSTPDVLESVNVLEAELAKLDDATSILISDSSWSAPVTPRTANVPFPEQGDQTKVYSRRTSFDYAGIALLDGSKRDLLKAMEMRRMMLLHEQKKAFSLATAAGFNVSVISDLMVFANCFGAPRLWEACLNFMTLCKKKQDTRQNPEESLFDTMSSGSTDSSIQLLSNKSETTESSDDTSNGSSKTKSRKTWDPQVLSTLQQLHSRKVEKSSLMSPDSKHIVRRQKAEDESPFPDEDLVVGARESVNNPHVLLQESFRSNVEHKTISVQDAISLFESKQKKAEDAVKKKNMKEDNEADKVVEPAKPVTAEAQTVAENETLQTYDASIVDAAAPELLPSAEASLEISQESSSGQRAHCQQIQQPARRSSALAVVAEATELEELDNIEWKPLSNSSGFVFDDMFLDRRNVTSNNNRRQSLCIWKTSELDIQESKMSDKDEQKGRFYDHYQEKREAKLKHEPVLKKVEKEAKLKAMQDVLEKRKAELSTRSMRLTDKSSNSSTKSSTSKKDLESKSCELKFSSKRGSPAASVHSAPMVSKADATHTRNISVRKSSPSSQKSSTTPRASLQPNSSTIKIQRRSAESLHSDQGKENVDPSYTSDVEGPQTFKFLERKSKSLSMVTKKAVDQTRKDASKGTKADGTLPQNRVIQQQRFSAQSSVNLDGSKLGKTKSDDTSSVSAEIYEMKLDGDDTESSCSCSVAVESSKVTEKENPAEDIEPEVTFLRIEVEDEVHLDDEAGKPVEVDNEEKEKPKENEEGEASTSADKFVIEDGDRTGGDKTEVPASIINTTEVHASIDMNVLIEELEREDEPTTNDAEVKLREEIVEKAAPETEETPAQVAEQNAPPPEIENAAPAPPKTTPTPLFELAELDQKQFPAAYKVDPPLEDFSSSTGTESTVGAVSSTSDLKVESFGSGKDEAESSAVFNSSVAAGSFLPKRVVAGGQTHKCTIFPAVLSRKSSSEARSSSEPGSPSKLPLFDLLATEHGGSSSNTASGIKPLKSSSSHKLSQVCRLPSPDTRGTAATMDGHKKVLQQKNSAPSCAKVSDSSSSKPLKGFRKFLRFGRRSCGATATSSAATVAAPGSSERIMWQNGWFKGE